MTGMPHSQKWQPILSKLYGDQKAAELLSRAQTYYANFWEQYADQSNQTHRALLKTRILPGLSIYKALLEEQGEPRKVLDVVETLFRAVFFTTLLQNIRLLNHLRNPFFIVRPVLKLMTRQAYLPGSQEVIEDSPDCYAINIYRCFIFDTLSQHNAQELTVLYCKTDDWLNEAMPRVSWERTKTLGKGNDCCNFRWCRIKMSDVSRR